VFKVTSMESSRINIFGTIIPNWLNVLIGGAVLYFTANAVSKQSEQGTETLRSMLAHYWPAFLLAATMIICSLLQYASAKTRNKVGGSTRAPKGVSQEDILEVRTQLGRLSRFEIFVVSQIIERSNINGEDVYLIVKEIGIPIETAMDQQAIIDSLYAIADKTSLLVTTGEGPLRLMAIKPNLRPATRLLLQAISPIIG
jgi:hypothetical protein